jgi:hypothetical protein
MPVRTIAAGHNERNNTDDNNTRDKKTFKSAAPGNKPIYNASTNRNAGAPGKAGAKVRYIILQVLRFAETADALRS